MRSFGHPQTGESGVENMARFVNRNRIVNRNREVRRGYTLVELLVVISIIGLLASMVTVAVQSAMRSAKVARAKTDILSLEAAIAAFKANYKADIPSSVTIPKAGNAWTNVSKSKIRRIWPQFNFANSGGWSKGTVTLSGGKCLMFFLGGIVDSGGTPQGFSRNARTPFSGSGGNRSGPFMEFDSSRVISSGDWYEYVDPLRRQLPGYSYVRKDDYTKTNAYARPPGTTNYYKPQSYQIISPGFDGKFGDGRPTSNVDDPDNDNITNFSDGMLND
jgi:prepilin-type N-terminal cleavage/methylation domain-containing protein